MKMGLAAAAAIAIVAVPAQANDAAVNAVYDRFAAAYAALEPAKLDQLYAPDATYLSRSPRLAIQNRDSILKGMGGFLDQVKANGGRLDIKFRVTDRKRFGDVIVDNGYMRLTTKPSKDVAEQLTDAKFILVMAKQPDGRWTFVSDADIETPAGSYDNAQPVQGVKFDR